MLRKASLEPHHKILMVLAAGVAISLFHLYPSFVYGLGPRASSTLFAGARLLHGELPYRDIWYGWVPGAVLCNAAALAVRRSGEAVLILEILFALVAAVVIYAHLRAAGRPARSGITAAGLLVFSVMGFVVLGGANGAGEWALPLFAGYAFLVWSARQGPGAGKAFAAGLCLGAAAIFVPGRAYLLLPGAALLGKRWPALVAGFVVVPGAALLGCVALGCYGDFFQDFVHYNKVLILEGMLNPGFRGGISELVKTTLVFLPVLAGFLRPQMESSAEEWYDPPFLRFLGFWIWLEFIGLLLAGGPAGPVSFVPMLVPAALLAGLHMNPGAEFQSQEKWSRIYTASALVGLIALTVHISGYFPVKGTSYTRLNEHNTGVLHTIVDPNSAPDEPILVWSGSAAVLFELDKPSATRFPTILPLLTRGYSEGAVQIFMDELAEKRPRLVIVEASLLRPGLEEYLEDFPAADTAGDNIDSLLNFMHRLMREEYATVKVHGGMIVMIRKD